MGARPETTAILGDRVDTDLEGGRRAGLFTIGVLSGSSLAGIRSVWADLILRTLPSADAWRAAVHVQSSAWSHRRSDGDNEQNG
jgi:ribonucleotide monophosphatase NagD (HAD superfamily)